MLRINKRMPIQPAFKQFQHAVEHARNHWGRSTCMLPRFMAWFTLCVTLIASTTPAHATTPHVPSSQTALTKRVYVPIASADLSRPDTVRVRSDRRYATEYGTLFVVGEVVNEGTTPVYGVELEATFFDAAGQVIDTVNGYARLEQTDPGQRNPFRLAFLNDPARVARHEVRVVNWETTSPFNPQPLAVVSQQTRNNDGLEIFGEVRNATATALENTLVVATLYDAKGNVVDVLPDMPYDYNAERTFDYTVRYEMASGSTSVYNLPSIQSTTYATYTVQAEGFVASAPSPAFTLRAAHRSIIDGTNYTVVGEVINEGTTTAYDVELEARFFNSANQLVAVARGFSYLGQTGAGKRSPFEILLTNAPAGITRYDVAAYAYQTGVLDYRPATVVSYNPTQAPGVTREVVGRVRNTQPVALADAYATVTFYDSSGKVVDVAFGYVDNLDADGNPQPIAPNTEVTYTASNGRSVTYNRYVVQAEGYVDPFAPLVQGTDARSERASEERSQPFFQRALRPGRHLMER
jgi:hypothetical protein